MNAVSQLIDFDVWHAEVIAESDGGYRSQ